MSAAPAQPLASLEFESFWIFSTIKCLQPLTAAGGQLLSNSGMCRQSIGWSTEQAAGVLPWARKGTESVKALLAAPYTAAAAAAAINAVCCTLGERVNLQQYGWAATYSNTLKVDFFLVSDAGMAA